MHTRPKLLHISISIPVAVGPFLPPSKDTPSIQKPSGNLFLWLLVRRNVSFAVVPLSSRWSPTDLPNEEPRKDSGRGLASNRAAARKNVYLPMSLTQLGFGSASKRSYRMEEPRKTPQLAACPILLSDSTRATVVFITFHFSPLSQGRSHPIYLADQ